MKAAKPSRKPTAAVASIVGVAVIQGLQGYLGDSVDTAQIKEAISGLVDLFKGSNAAVYYLAAIYAIERLFSWRADKNRQPEEVIELTDEV